MKGELYNTLHQGITRKAQFDSTIASEILVIKTEIKTKTMRCHFWKTEIQIKIHLKNKNDIEIKNAPKNLQKLKLK
jgi:hypothetical protein